ncbi:MAG TPA: PrsW family glutamic-type intramembrane protease [Verrucomicrobiae bacterium]|nr:PrsW family glutamic-type intramembrane protease [Verrucomicrobiae bacterium]
MSSQTIIMLLVALGGPVVVAGGVWYWCRRPFGPGAFTLAFFLGALVVLPAIRLGNGVEPSIAGLIEHYYLNELIGQFLTTALPEELGKGLVALLMIWILRKTPAPLTWLAAGAVSYCGFACLEGMLGALGNEGLLKTLLGRSIGACFHCSWGIIMTWFAWKGWQQGQSRFWTWPFALLVPTALHTIGNASLMEIPPGANEHLPVLSGMAAGLITLTLAGRSLYAARRVPTLDGAR